MASPKNGCAAPPPQPARGCPRAGFKNARRLPAGIGLALIALQAPLLAEIAKMRGTSPQETAMDLVIEDNGRGVSSAERSAFGNGLHHMERRMKNVGGPFRLVTQPGGGTRIRLEVPLKNESLK